MLARDPHPVLIRPLAPPRARTQRPTARRYPTCQTTGVRLHHRPRFAALPVPVRGGGQLPRRTTPFGVVILQRHIFEERSWPFAALDYTCTSRQHLAESGRGVPPAIAVNKSSPPPSVILFSIPHPRLYHPPSISSSTRSPKLLPRWSPRVVHFDFSRRPNTYGGDGAQLSVPTSRSSRHE